MNGSWANGHVTKHTHSSLMENGSNMWGHVLQILRDKNHPSIIVWSCGNESGYGKAHSDMAKFYRQLDPSRPTHYEVQPSFRACPHHLLTLLRPLCQALDPKRVLQG